MNCAVSAFSKSHPCFCCCSAYLQTADKTSWCGKTLSVVAGFRIHMQSKKKKEEEGEESVSMLRNVWVCVCVWCVPVCVCTLARVPTSMRVTELVCYSAVKYPEMACLQGFVRV